MQFERVFICLAISLLTKFAVGKPKPLAVLQAKVSKIVTDAVSVESSLNQLEYLYGVCENGWIRHGSSCYYFSMKEEALSWPDALMQCWAKGGYLVEINNEEENQFIEEKAKLLGITSINLEECRNSFLTGSYRVPDSALSASSSWDSNHDPARSRLHTPVALPLRGGWSAKSNDQSQWIQVDLQKTVTVTGIVTQGRNSAITNQWVKKFAVEYSLDCSDWTSVDQVFEGNTDKDTPVTNMFIKHVTARCIRIRPKEWHTHISLRFDILGCSEEECRNSFLTGSYRVPDSALSASSSWDSNHDPARSRLHTPVALPLRGGWSAKSNDQSQWIQVDLQKAVTVTGIVTQGRNSAVDNQWVTKFAVEYSLDCSDWTSVDQVFEGNTDKDTPVTNMFIKHVKARCVRIRPKKWHTHISLRFDILGCSLDTGLSLWLGGTDILHEGNFKWANGGTLISNTFLDWRPSHPDEVGNDEHCLIMNSETGWHNVVCSTENRFVCENDIE